MNQMTRGENKSKVITIITSFTFITIITSFTFITPLLDPISIIRKCDDRLQCRTYIDPLNKSEAFYNICL